MRRVWSLMMLAVVGALPGPADARAGVVPPEMVSKVQSVLIEQWKTASTRARERTAIESFLLMTGRATDERLSALAESGFVVRSIIPRAHAGRGRERYARHTATILTGHVALQDVPAVAALPFVERLEGASRLGGKWPGGGRVPVTK
ncbi:MAG: hypothetical protein HYV02_05865 [Deltaproteobacteria bacterium]|nr:hypothetical protein [Deltaproteobacteria bacterium]